MNIQRSELIGLFFGGVAIGGFLVFGVSKISKAFSVKEEVVSTFHEEIELPWLALCYTEGNSTPIWHSQLQEGTERTIVLRKGIPFYEWVDIENRKHSYPVSQEGFSVLFAQEIRTYEDTSIPLPYNDSWINTPINIEIPEDVASNN